MLRNIVKPNTYYDSVTLMAISREISGLEGIEDVAVMMATENNKSILAGAGLLDGEGDKATAGDLLIAVKYSQESCLGVVLAKVEKALNKGSGAQPGSGFGQADAPPRTLGSALQKLPGANLAIISVPGEYAAREARRALDSGLNVFLFSDNVLLEDEVALKRKAAQKGLLLMGPDCGTAYLNGAAIGFANVVNPGRIGLVAASGTGLQEVACLIAKNGGGISHGIGAGGRDLKEEVGGITMLQGLEMLAADAKTKVIVLVSKPPAPRVEEKILAALSRINKPAVVCFLGGERCCHENKRIHFAQTLEEAAFMALAMEQETDITKSLVEDCYELKEIAHVETEKFHASQKYVRGLFSGGTLCNEALLIFQQLAGDAYSNVPLKPYLKLRDANRPVEHSFIDLGEDEFTRGRPHPMMDPALRREKVLAESADPETAVILLDVVLGYCSHPDPAGVLASGISKARELAAKEGRYLSFIASVCGTAGDPQGYDGQVRKLEEAGVLVMKSNAEASRLAARIAVNLMGKRGEEK